MANAIDTYSGSPRPVAWRAVRASGVDTLINKATQGTNYVNPYHATDVAGARAAGMGVAAYHFAGGGSPAAEAAWFLAHAECHALALDYEVSSPDAAWVLDFLAAMPRPIAVYCALWTRSQIAAAADSPKFAGWWLAEPGMTPPSVPRTMLWQYSWQGDVPGMGKPVDLDLVTDASMFGAWLQQAPTQPTTSSQGGQGQVAWTDQNWTVIVTYRAVLGRYPTAEEQTAGVKELQAGKTGNQLIEQLRAQYPAG